jgi:hypothetical protein
MVPELHLSLSYQANCNQLNIVDDFFYSRELNVSKKLIN